MHWPRVVFKETNVGFWNGAAVAFTTGIVVYVWSGSYGLPIIVAASMILSMVIAGIAGAAIPHAADGAAAGPGAILLDHPYHRDRRDGLLQLPRHRDPLEQHDLTCAGQHACASLRCVTIGSRLELPRFRGRLWIWARGGVADRSPGHECGRHFAGAGRPVGLEWRVPATRRAPVAVRPSSARGGVRAGGSAAARRCDRGHRQARPGGRRR